MIAHSDAHVLLVGVETWFLATITRQDVMLAKHVDHDFCGCIGRQHLTKEVVGLCGHDTEEGHRAQLLLEIGTFYNKLLTCLKIILLVLVIDLHEELGEGVEVPDAHLFLYLGDKILIGRSEDAQTKAWYTKALGDTLHHRHVGIGFENLVREQGICGIVNTEIHETLIDHQSDVSFLTPLGQSQHIGLGDIIT